MKKNNIKTNELAKKDLPQPKFTPYGDEISVRRAKYTAGHTEGNVFTGEQISVTRNYELDRAITTDDIKS